MTAFDLTSAIQARGKVARSASARRAATRERGPWPRDAGLSVNLTGVMPIAKGSMRAFMPTGARHPVVTDSKTAELRAFERDLRQIAGREMDRLQLPCASSQPFELLVVFYLPRPSGDYDKHGEPKGGARAAPWIKPDIDKLARSLMDALTGLAFDDDSRVVRIVAEKRYATKARDMGVWFELRNRPATMREVGDMARRIDKQPRLPLPRSETCET